MTDPVELAYKGPLAAISPEARQSLVARQGTLPEEAVSKVEQMAQRIRTEGDRALITFTERFDGVKLDGLRVPARAIQRAYDAAPAEFLDALTVATEQVRAYHERMVERRSPIFTQAGVTAYERHVPVGRAGLYVPGGQAAYPSTVLMTAVPAQAAGVEEIIVASPPGPDGTPHELVLATCHALGIEHVVPLGGAQAILALALGTEHVPACDVVAGPGNAYVQAAKQHVAGQVRIDAPAGPSEVAVLLGPSGEPSVAAREMVAQAEHAPDTLAVCLCMNEGEALLVHDALTHEVARAKREETIRDALAARGALLVVDDLPEAIAFLDQLAPEHCVLLHDAGDEIADRLTGPACIVAGPHACVALTDYAAGPSHVLPTGGHARAYGGIGVETFIKRVHVALLDEPDEALTDAAATLARLEGLGAHARALLEGSR